MNFKGFTYLVSAEVEFSRAELEQLSELARKHYDGRCKAAAERGGLLYGMLNMLFGNDIAELTVSGNDVDLLCKISEAENVFRIFPGGKPLLGDLGFKLSQLLRKIAEESKRINNEVEWLPTI